MDFKGSSLKFVTTPLVFFWVGGGGFICGDPRDQPLPEAYLERQKRGPDLARLRCSAAADDLVKEGIGSGVGGRR